MRKWLVGEVKVRPGSSITVFAVVHHIVLSPFLLAVRGVDLPRHSFISSGPRYALDTRIVPGAVKPCFG